MTSQLRLHTKMASAEHGLITAQVVHWANLLPNPPHFQVPFLLEPQDLLIKMGLRCD